MDCSLPGSSVHGIFQAENLEWIVISFSRGSSWPRDWTRVSHIVDRRFTVYEHWGTYIFFELAFLFSSGIYPGVELLDHMMVLFLGFWGISIFLEIFWLQKFTFPPTVYEGSSSSAPSPAFAIWAHFGHGHSVRCEVISCGFDLHFSEAYRCWGSFHVPVGHLYESVAVVQLLSHVQLLWPHGLQHARLPCPSLSPKDCSNSCPLSRSCHPTILSLVAPFSSCLQSFPASGSFQMSWLFASGSQSIGASALASVLPVNSQGWFPLGLTGLISSLSKGLSESSPAPQFKSTNSLALSLLCGPTLTSIHDYWKNHSFDYMDHCWQSDVSAF